MATKRAKRKTTKRRAIGKSGVATAKRITAKCRWKKTINGVQVYDTLL